MSPTSFDTSDVTWKSFGQSSSDLPGTGTPAASKSQKERWRFETEAKKPNQPKVPYQDLRVPGHLQSTLVTTSLDRNDVKVSGLSMQSNRGVWFDNRDPRATTALAKVLERDGAKNKGRYNQEYSSTIRAANPPSFSPPTKSMRYISSGETTGQGNKRSESQAKNIAAYPKPDLISTVCNRATSFDVICSVNTSTDHLQHKRSR